MYIKFLNTETQLSLNTETQLSFLICYTARTTTITTTSVFITSTTNTPLTTTSPATPSTSLSTLIIIVAIVLGFLLLLVACAVLSLTCVIICKKRKRASSPLRIHSLRPNTYEVSTSSIGEGFKKVDNCTLSTEKPKMQPDPEYATLSEWREMADAPLHNPFYDSSTSIESKSCAAAVEVPQLQWSGSAWDTTPPANQNSSETRLQQNSGQVVIGRRMTTKSHSMHDMRGNITINNERSFQRDGSTTVNSSHSVLMRSFDRHIPPISSSPPPLPSSPPPPALPSTRPPPPPTLKKKGNTRYAGAGASSTPHPPCGSGGKNGVGGSCGNAISPLVQHNMRAKNTQHSHEVFNAEYGVINGIQNSNRPRKD